ncbi:MAG: DUF3800 domain-containing protein [Rhodanobacter sp.]
MSHSICYIDEAGCTEPLASSTVVTQPVFLVTALFVEEAQVRQMTDDFTQLKRKYFPGSFANIRHQLDAMTIELKGIDIKKALRGDNGPQQQKIHQRFVDDLLKLVKSFDGKIVSKIWVKGVGKKFKGHDVYSMSTQDIAMLFEDHLFRRTHKGIIVSDFRSPGNNRIISHSIFTQMYRRKLTGNAYPSLLEAPLFGVSNNHAGLQITDILTSALLCPMATVTYCSGYVTNIHVAQNDREILKRYKRRVSALQYTTVMGQKTIRGISVKDAHARRTAHAMLV